MQSVYQMIKQESLLRKSILFYPNANINNFLIKQLDYDCVIMTFRPRNEVDKRDQFNYAFNNIHQDYVFYKGSDRCRVYKTKPEENEQMIFCIFEDPRTVLSDLEERNIAIDAFVAWEDEDLNYSSNEYTDNEWLYRILFLFKEKAHFIFNNAQIRHDYNPIVSIDDIENYYSKITHLSRICEYVDSDNNYSMNLQLKCKQKLRRQLYLNVTFTEGWKSLRQKLHTENNTSAFKVLKVKKHFEQNSNCLK